MTKMMKIAFQGEPGANSHIAIAEAYPDAEPMPCATFEDALAVIASGEADLGMIPIENSIAGRVTDIHYLLPPSDLRSTLGDCARFILPVPPPRMARARATIMSGFTHIAARPCNALSSCRPRLSSDRNGSSSCGRWKAECG